MPLQRISHAGAAAPTNLVTAISATATSFSIVSSTGWPSGSTGPFVMDIDPGLPTEEKILCSSLSGGVVTVATNGRGWDGTTPVAHQPGTAQVPTVSLIFSASEADDANAHIYDTTRNDHSQYTLADGASATTTFVHNSSTLTLPADVAVNLALDSISWGGNYNGSTFTYTCPVTGYYEVFGSINSPGLSALGVLKGSAGLVVLGPASTAATNPYSGLAENRAWVKAILAANAGDTFYLQVRDETGGPVASQPYETYATYTLLH